MIGLTSLLVLMLAAGTLLPMLIVAGKKQIFTSRVYHATVELENILEKISSTVTPNELEKLIQNPEKYRFELSAAFQERNPEAYLKSEYEIFPEGVKVSLEIRGPDPGGFDTSLIKVIYWRHRGIAP